MKKISLLLISALLIANLGFSQVVKLSDAMIIPADVSHKSVIHLSIPQLCNAVVLFEGNDFAVETNDDNSSVSAEIKNKGCAVIIHSGGADVGKIIPIQILTREERTHTIFLHILDKNCTNADIKAKAIIDDELKAIEITIKD